MKMLIWKIWAWCTATVKQNLLGYNNAEDCG